MSQQVKVTIELENGTTLKHYKAVRIEQDLFSHHRFAVTVPIEALENKGENFFHKAHKDVCGKGISFSFTRVLKEATFEFVFKGIITEINLINTSALSNAYVLKGFSPTILLEDGVQKRIFKGQSIQQIFDKVLGEYPSNTLKRKLNPKNGSEEAYQVQYNESNFAFLNRLADKYHEWFFYNGKELQLGNSGAATKDFEINGLQTFDMSIALKPSKFMMARYNYFENKTFSSEGDNQNIDGQNSLSSFASQESANLFGIKAKISPSVGIKDQSQLDGIVKSHKSVEATNMVTFNGKGENAEISIGTIVNVLGSKIENGQKSQESFGKYRVTQITHEITGTNYTNSFQAVPESAEFPASNPFVSQPKAYTELAEVIDNDDPEKLGRVKVRFLWANTDAADCETGWLRVSSPYTGEGWGISFVPELKAQVMVSYGEGNPEMGYVSGSMYPKLDDDHDYTKPNNEKKQISTKTLSMFFWENDNRNSITFKHFPKDSKSASEDTFVKLEFKDNKIFIKASAEINVEGGTINVSGTDVNVKASGNIKMEADGDISMKATGNIKMEATANLEAKATADIKLEATANFEATGTAQATVKGTGTAEISSSGMTTVKGSVVMIN